MKRITSQWQSDERTGEGKARRFQEKLSDGRARYRIELQGNCVAMPRDARARQRRATRSIEQRRQSKAKIRRSWQRQSMETQTAARAKALHNAETACIEAQWHCIELNAMAWQSQDERCTAKAEHRISQTGRAKAEQCIDTLGIATAKQREEKRSKGTARQRNSKTKKQKQK